MAEMSRRRRKVKCAGRPEPNKGKRWEESITSFSLALANCWQYACMSSSDRRMTTALYIKCLESKVCDLELLFERQAKLTPRDTGPAEGV